MVVINLVEHGDGIYAGIALGELIALTPKLSQQMKANKGEGHFYYAHVVSDSHARWAALAQRLYQAGLR